MENLDQSPVSFSLDYEVMFSLIREQEEIGNYLVGFFHSHPAGSTLYPSMKDRYFMRNWPYPYLWLIGGSGSELALFIFAFMKEKILSLPYSVQELDLS